MKRFLFILITFLLNNITSLNMVSAKTNNLICENILTKNKTNIVYNKNFAKEEMSPNIWLFFHKIKLENGILNIVSLDDKKPIREWTINLVSGEAKLVPMFDPSSKWLCKI